MKAGAPGNPFLYHELQYRSKRSPQGVYYNEPFCPACLESLEAQRYNSPCAAQSLRRFAHPSQQPQQQASQQSQAIPYGLQSGVATQYQCSVPNNPIPVVLQVEETKLPKCECGAESAGCGGHSSWCPKTEVT